MKHIKSITISVILIQIIFITFLILTSNIQNVTLATENICSFDDGWIFVNGDNTVIPIDSIPYFANSKKNENVSIYNTIPTEFCGKTLCFLSADKYIHIYIDSNLIYSFGINDRKAIGHTPGSVMVFADIPLDSAGKKIEIKTYSPYDNYASYITNMVVGDRDICILHFIKKNMIPFIICIGIFICSIIIFMFAVFRKLTNQPYLHVTCLGMYMTVMAIYNLIETKIPMIFFGNQYIYSNLVFLSLMVAPLLVVAYMYSLSTKYKNILKVLIYISLFNIILQLILQALNLVDFLEMAFISHGITASIITIVLIEESIEAIRRKKNSTNYIGIIAMGIGGAIDLIRCYVIKVGDFSRFSRIGLLIFGICSVIHYMNDIIANQIKYAQNKKSEEYSSEIIKTLVTAIDAKDIYTKGHSTRVAEYAAIMAKKLGWDEEQIKQVKYKAMLHDIGKIGIPDRVLNKADRLTDDEYEIIKLHTSIGSDILQEVTSLADMSLVARNHHERYDGKGYPDMLSGNDIPIEARIVGIVDTFDAMSSDRAYRKALPKEIIRSEIIKGRGTQFDPELTDEFLSLYDNGAFDAFISEKVNPDHNIDISRVLNNLIDSSAIKGALNIDSAELNKICHYINGLHERFGITYNVVLISLACDDDISKDDLKQAMSAMEYCIMQSLRKVDVLSRVSATQFIVIFTESHQENIKQIMDRIFTSFYRNCQSTKVKPEYVLKI